MEFSGVLFKGLREALSANLANRVLSIYCTQHLSPLFRLTLEQTLFTLHEFYLKMRNTLHMHMRVQYQEGLHAATVARVAIEL